MTAYEDKFRLDFRRVRIDSVDAAAKPWPVVQVMDVQEGFYPLDIRVYTVGMVRLPNPGEIWWITRKFGQWHLSHLDIAANPAWEAGSAYGGLPSPVGSGDAGSAGTSHFPAAADHVHPTAASRYAASLGNGVDDEFAVLHNLNSRDVIIQFYDTATYGLIAPDVTGIYAARTTVNLVTVSFSFVPTASQYRIVIIR